MKNGGERVPEMVDLIGALEVLLAAVMAADV